MSSLHDHFHLSPYFFSLFLCVSLISTDFRNALSPFIDNRESLVHPAHPLTQADASKLLFLGLKSLSRFDRYCPVCALDSGTTEVIDLKKGVPQFPALYRNHILYFCSELHRACFLENPYRFLNLLSPSPASLMQSQALIIKPCCCVLGAAFSGKTELSHRIAAEEGRIKLPVICYVCCPVSRCLDCILAYFLSSSSSSSSSSSPPPPPPPPPFSSRHGVSKYASCA